MRAFLLLCVVAASSAFSVSAGARAPSVTPRAPVPVANLFENLGKIVDYNTKFIGTAIAGMTDSRMASASHILFGFKEQEPPKALAQAEEVKAKIASGEMSFADAAAQFSSCPSKAKGGSLGEFKRGAMVPEFDAVCFDVDVPLGGLEGPIKTQFGYHLIQVTSRTEA